MRRSIPTAYNSRKQRIEVFCFDAQKRPKYRVGDWWQSDMCKLYPSVGGEPIDDTCGRKRIPFYNGARQAK